MRRRAVSIALLVALALAGAGRADARGAVSGGQEWLGGTDDQPALLSSVHEDQRPARPADRRTSKSPAGAAPALLPATGISSSAPSLILLGRARPPGPPACPGPYGSTRTSRGPPPSDGPRS